MKVACVLLSVLLLSGCATNPVTGRKEVALVSERQEIQMGTEQYPYLIQMSGGPYTLDAELSRYVEDIGRKLAAASDRPPTAVSAALADDLTGRFRLRTEDGGARLECHLEARENGAPGGAAEAALVDLERWLWRRGGVATRVVRHPSGAYPYHPEGDWTHKARYVSAGGAR